ncbi:hypothetical protein INR49_000079 [Caranx melampygus]|nr:hypothetical protein INR49_000079 [Caranx melampygus]
MTQENVLYLCFSLRSVLTGGNTMGIPLTYRSRNQTKRGDATLRYWGPCITDEAESHRPDHCRISPK